jgi:7-cyano-7-deazaguanine synthase
MTDKKQAVVLLSGGLDSATCCAIAREDGFELCALSFAYGQRHSVELHAAERVSRFFSIKDHLIISINAPVFGASSLTSATEVPKNRDLDASGQDIPSTYVPARNTIFLAYALAYAEKMGSRDIYVGVNALDYSGYPDCRPEFIRAFEAMANLATKAGVEGKKMTIHAPLINLTKAQIIQKGTGLGIDYGMTHSCYDPSPSGLACGVCDSCLLRKKGFAEAGVKDPTAYQTQKNL